MELRERLTKFLSIHLLFWLLLFNYTLYLFRNALLLFLSLFIYFINNNFAQLGYQFALFLRFLCLLIRTSLLSFVLLYFLWQYATPFTIIIQIDAFNWSYIINTPWYHIRKLAGRLSLFPVLTKLVIVSKLCEFW